MLRYLPLIISPLSAIVLGVNSVLYHLAALFGLTTTSFIAGRFMHSVFYGHHTEDLCIRLGNTQVRIASVSSIFCVG